VDCSGFGSADNSNLFASDCRRFNGTEALLGLPDPYRAPPSSEGEFPVVVVSADFDVRRAAPTPGRTFIFDLPVDPALAAAVSEAAATQNCAQLESECQWQNGRTKEWSGEGCELVEWNLEESTAKCRFAIISRHSSSSFPDLSPSAFVLRSGLMYLVLCCWLSLCCPVVKD